MPDTRRHSRRQQAENGARPDRSVRNPGPAGLERNGMATASDIPEPDDLRRRFALVNRRGNAALAVMIAAAVVAVCFVDYRELSQRPIVAAVAGLMAPWPFFWGLVQVMGVKKKRAEDLRPDARFGEFGPREIVAVVDGVRRRLPWVADGPAADANVFLVRDKSANAAAVSVGLLRLVKPLQGVFIHRQLLHLLKPDELAAVVGHEFGHLAKVSLSLDRHAATFTLATAVLCVAAASRTGDRGGAELFVALVLAWALQFGWNALRGDSGHVAEYLCDAAGAEASDRLAAANALLQIAADAERQTGLYVWCLEQWLDGHASSPAEAMDALDDALPFGVTEGDGVKEEVAARLGAKADAGPSVGGFLGFLMSGDDDLDAADAARAQVAQWQAVQKLPRLDWERFAGPDGRLDAAGAAALVAAAGREPQKVWFRLAEEAGAGSTHPTTRRRVLCLLVAG